MTEQTGTLYEPDVEFLPETDLHRGETPSSVEEADRWQAELASRIRWIDSQLGDQTRKQDYSPGDYKAWRRRAIAAKTHLQDERQRLQRWIQGQKAEERQRQYEERQRRHEAYMASRQQRTVQLREERQKYPVLDDAYDSVRLLHEVFAAASLLVDDDSDENWQGLMEAVQFARGWREEKGR